MEEKYKKAKKILKQYNQEHILNFYKELTTEQQEQFINQILNTNFEEIITLYKNSMKNNHTKEKITPLEHYEKKELKKEEIKQYTEIGEKILKDKKYAVVTMAGGQGTRLGYKKPKGTYELKLGKEKKSLFQIICEDIKRANKKYNITIPWFIMTSQENDKATKAFFEEHNNFGYPQTEITFFTQGKLPIINTEGKIILDRIDCIKEASNGNGNVFISMQNHKIIDILEKKGIEWISFGGIDNILLKNVDPLFLGMTISQKKQIASKSIFKKGPLEKTAIYCRKNGKPAILDYNEIDIKLSEKKDENGKYLYREANIISHLMNIKAIKKVSNIQLPYHRAYKKNDYINSEGVKTVPSNPNTFKFENFIFDAFKYFDDMLLLRVKEKEEFAPIKDFTGIYSPETAKIKYEKYWKIKKDENSE